MPADLLAEPFVCYILLVYDFVMPNYKTVTNGFILLNIVFLRDVSFA